MVNMLDDHDCIDGWGSYKAEWMEAPVFQACVPCRWRTTPALTAFVHSIYSRGYFWYLLFQNATVDARDLPTQPDQLHTFRSIVLGSPDSIPYLEANWLGRPKQPRACSHSYVVYLGPRVAMCLVDARAERTLEQVCHPDTYARLFDKFQRMSRNVRHLLIQIGVPLAYTRFNGIERALGVSSITLQAFGLDSGANKFDGQLELLDDLNDHWCSDKHKQERNQLVQWLQQVAANQQLRVTFLSGDVHCASASYFRSKHWEYDPLSNSLSIATRDPYFMVQVRSLQDACDRLLTSLADRHVCHRQPAATRCPAQLYRQARWRDAHVDRQRARDDARVVQEREAVAHQGRAELPARRGRTRGHARLHARR